MSRGHFVDPIRARAIAATPEERVRQRMLAHLRKLGYPAHLMRIEVKLEGTARRLDIVCYGCVGEDLLPLLLVECKAAKVTPKALSQIIGYNYHLKAPFICLAGGKSLECYAADNFDSPIELPGFEEALSCLRGT